MNRWQPGAGATGSAACWPELALPSAPHQPSARGYPRPLAGRSRRPSRPPFPARSLRFAILAALAAVARSWARAPPRSSTRSRHKQAASGSTEPAVSWALHAHFPCHCPRPGGRKPPMRTSRSVRTLASHASAQGKPGRKPGLSVKPAPPGLFMIRTVGANFLNPLQVRSWRSAGPATEDRSGSRRPGCRP